MPHTALCAPSLATYSNTKKLFISVVKIKSQNRGAVLHEVRPYSGELTRVRETCRRNEGKCFWEKKGMRGKKISQGTSLAGRELYFLSISRFYLQQKGSFLFEE